MIEVRDSAFDVYLRFKPNSRPVMMSPRDWAAGSTLRSAALMGALFGTAEVVRAIATGQGAAGVLVGILAGVAFGALMGRFVGRTTRDLSGFSPQQRSQVARAVRRGEAPQDASLAAATIERARRLQEQSDRRWPYLVLGAFAVLALVIAVANAIAGSLSVGAVILVVFWLLFLPLMKWNAARIRERASNAEAQARRIGGAIPPR